MDYLHWLALVLCSGAFVGAYVRFIVVPASGFKNWLGGLVVAFALGALLAAYVNYSAWPRILADLAANGLQVTQDV